MRIRKIAILWANLWILFGAMGCATTRFATDPSSTPATAKAQAPAEDEVTILKRQVQSLDTQVSELTHQLSMTQISLQNALGIKKPELKSLPEDPTANRGAAPIVHLSSRDPASGMSLSEGLLQFRHARSLIDAQKYPEAVLEFTGFLKEHADHFLASSAQFHLAESYFIQKEWRLAREEFEQLLIAYDRSSYLPQTFYRLSLIHLQLQEPEKAKNYRKTLLTYFPNSPAAQTAENLVLEDAPRSEEPKAEAKPSTHAKAKSVNKPIQAFSNQAELDALPFQTAPLPATFVGDRR